MSKEILVMSDSHGDACAVREIAEANSAKVNMFIHLGDGIREFLEVMGEIGCENYRYVAGNHEDDSIYQQSPDFEVLQLNGHRVLITHGDIYENKLDLLGVAHIARMNRAEIALCGHTHTATDQTIHGIRVINPGALRYWRDDGPKYAILTINEEAKDISAEIINYKPQMCYHKR